jgi:hypothetical protein
MSPQISADGRGSKEAAANFANEHESKVNKIRVFCIDSRQHFLLSAFICEICGKSLSFLNPRK